MQAGGEIAAFPQATAKQRVRRLRRRRREQEIGGGIIRGWILAIILILCRPDSEPLKGHRMPTPAESVVRQVLEPRHAVILDAVTGGWAECRAMPQIGWWRRKSTRAGIVWEETVERAIQGFVEDGGVRVVNHFDTRSFLVEDRVLFRFKKGDVHLFSRSYPTQLALAFHDHKEDLFGHSSLMRVEVVHTLNRRQTEIECVAVVARDRRRMFWCTK